MNNTVAPETFNGKPTRYEFFDGFKDSSFLMKAVYILFMPIVPIVVELKASQDAKINYKDSLIPFPIID